MYKYFSMTNEIETRLLYDRIEEILEEARECIDKGEFELQFSKKNIDTFRKIRRELGITLEDFEDEILEAIKKLTKENYYQGPKADDNKERDFVFWVFGTEVFGKEIYLKFDIREKNGKRLVVWSYHFPEYNIYYPFRKK